jgi:hypothetical protein
MMADDDGRGRWPVGHSQKLTVHVDRADFARIFFGRKA